MLTITKTISAGVIINSGSNNNEINIISGANITCCLQTKTISNKKNEGDRRKKKTIIITECVKHLEKAHTQRLHL
jgi:hypothetical protein